MRKIDDEGEFARGTELAPLNGTLTLGIVKNGIVDKNFICSIKDYPYHSPGLISFLSSETPREVSPTCFRTNTMYNTIERNYLTSALGCASCIFAINRRSASPKYLATTGEGYLFCDNCFENFTSYEESYLTENCYVLTLLDEERNYYFSRKPY